MMEKSMLWGDEQILFIDSLLAVGHSFEYINESFNSRFIVPSGLEPITVKTLQAKYKELKSIEDISLPIFFKIAINLPKRYLSKLLSKSSKSDKRCVWKVADVSNTRGPSDNVRNYLDRKNLRKCLNGIVKNRNTSKAADIGCGYGRLTITLPEFFKEVIGFEREAHFVEIAKTLNPNIKFFQTKTLTKIDAEDNYFDFAMTSTVLQHMIDNEAKAVISEMKRIVGEGYILLCEDTDLTECYGDTSKPKEFLMKGRSIKTYENWMQPFKLIKIVDRVIEPTYHKMSAGTFMIFKR